MMNDLFYFIFYSIATLIQLSLYFLIPMLLLFFTFFIVERKLLSTPENVLPPPPFFKSSRVFISQLFQFRTYQLLRDFFYSQSHHIFILIYPIILLIIFTFIITPTYALIRGKRFQLQLLPNMLSFPNSRTAVYLVISIVLGMIFAIGWARLELRPYTKLFSLNVIGLVLLAVTTVFELAALLDNFYSRQYLSFSALSFFFIITYFWLFKGWLRNTNAAVGLSDLGVILLLNTLPQGGGKFQRKVCADLKHGKVYKAYLRFKWHIFWREFIRRQFKFSKEQLKLEAMIYYRLECYSKVLRIAVEGNDKLRRQGDFSDTLLDFQALAHAHLGQLHEARQTLIERLNQAASNPYHKYNLAYIYWQSYDIQSAFKSLSEALAIAPPGLLVPALGFKANLLCDLALSKYLENPSALPTKVNQARGLIKEAIRQREHIKGLHSIHLEDQLEYLLGYVDLLERRYDKTVQKFSRCVRRSLRLESRFQLGLLYMIGTRDYAAAIEQFKLILATIRFRTQRGQLFRKHVPVEYKLHFYKIVEKNLERAREASKRGIVLSDKIIFYQQVNSNGDLLEKAIMRTEEEKKIAQQIKQLFQFKLFPMRMSSWYGDQTAVFEWPSVNKMLEIVREVRDEIIDWYRYKRTLAELNEQDET